MRMRRLKWAEAHLNECELIEKNPSLNKGKWRDVLNREIIHVEIGTGKGDYWINMAKLYPNIGWIGIEKNESVAAIATRKAQEENLDNIKYIYKDAENLEEWFDDKEINVIHLNFSDPWPKKRNSKRRLSHAGFINKYFKLIKDDGEIQMKTDNIDLFEFSLVEFVNENYKLRDVSVDFRRVEHPEDVITEYENKFMDLGQPIYRAVFYKGDNYEK